MQFQIDQFKKLGLVYSIIVAIIALGMFRTVFGLKTISEQRYILHTQTEIVVLCRSHAKGEQAIQKAFDRISEIETKVNFFDIKSEISSVNRLAAFREVPVSDELFFILQKAQWGSEVTDGAFDITTTPLSRLYGFGTDTFKVPSSTQVKKAMEKVGYQNVILNEAKKTVRFVKKGIMLDLGGIAKGYAIDEAAKVLRANGIRSGFVNAGGNIYAIGRTRNFAPWTIGIRDPRAPQKIAGTIKLINSAVATSGDYEQFFIKGHKRYHHIMNPKTGQSASGMISATIEAKDGITTDVLSTGIFVLGPEKGTEVLKKLGLHGVLIYQKDKKITVQKV